jgi:hypothetical protein
MLKRTKDVTNPFPLAENQDDLNNPAFLAKVENGYFKQPNLIHPVHGGPSFKFKNDFMRQVYYLARLGARLDDIAEFFGVNPRTVDLWKAKNADFNEAWHEGHWVFGMKVGETLGQKALGYNYTETEYSQHVDREGNIRDLKKVTHKHMPPSDVAIIFYLKNRHRDLWMDVNRTEIDTRMQVDIVKKLDMTSLNEDERKMIKSIAIKNISTTHGIANN